MDVRHLDRKLERVERDASYHASLGPEVAKAFRKRMQFIRAAADERDFHTMKSLHYEKLRGNREGQRSMRLNDQWRLVLRVEVAAGKTAVIIEVVDYH